MQRFRRDLLWQIKPARKQKSIGMSMFAMRVNSERKAHKKKVQLIERKR